jgi:hypothetical protein
MYEVDSNGGSASDAGQRQNLSLPQNRGDGAEHKSKHNDALNQYSNEHYRIVRGALQEASEVRENAGRERRPRYSLGYQALERHDLSWPNQNFDLNRCTKR